MERGHTPSPNRAIQHSFANDVIHALRIGSKDDYRKVELRVPCYTWRIRTAPHTILYYGATAFAGRVRQTGSPNHGKH